MSQLLEIPSLAHSAELAGNVAQLPHGTLVLLSGPLGVGKTTVTQMIAKALGSDAQVSSPTYTLVNEYPTPEGTLVHIDAYRLGDAMALEQLGLDEYLERGRLVIVEWGEELLHEFPEAEFLRLDFASNELDDERRKVTWLSRTREP